MTEVNTPEIEKLVINLKEFYRLLSHIGSHKSLSLLYESQLTMPQIITLHYVFHCERVSISAISETLQLSLGATSHLVDKLVRKGYLSRDENPEDRRVRYISITEMGADFITRLNESRTYDMANALALLDPEGIEKLTGVIIEVNEKLKNRYNNEGKGLCRE